MKPKPPVAVMASGDKTMLIYVLAAAMTVAMLIATFVGLHQETERLRLQEKVARSRGFGNTRRRY
jgi:hypothetical protein